MTQNIASQCAQACSLLSADEDVADFLGIDHYRKIVVDAHVCLAGHNSEQNWIVCRGSQSIEDWADDLRFRLIQDNRFPGCIHRGFADVFSDLYGDVCDQLNFELPIQITGHSLGGAVATLFGWMLHSKNAAPVITFGAPPVGDQDFANNFASLGPAVWRYIYRDDVVPYLLPFLIQTGEHVQLAGGGWHLIRAILNGFPQAVIQGIQDHAIANYAAALAGDDTGATA